LSQNKRCSECGATNFWFGQGNLLETPPGAETRLRRTPRKTVRATGVEKHQLCVSSKWNVRAGNLAERHFDLILRKPFSGNNLVYHENPSLPRSKTRRQVGRMHPTSLILAVLSQPSISVC
jgi:hypothetical protein